MLKMYLIFEVLCFIGAFVGTARVVQTINKYSLSGHLLPIKEKHLTESFSSDYTPALKKWGVYWFTSVRGSVCLSVRPSVIP